MLCIVFYSLIAIYLFIIPKEADLLLSHYPVINKSKNKVSYHWSQKRPKNWSSISNINIKAAQAIIISEDWNFFVHRGIDLQQIQQAFLDKIILNKHWRGASTITQQVVKNIFLSKQKRLWRKIKELLIATYIEQKLSKPRILEIYLNVIEYGQGLYGIHDAAKHYFHKSPMELRAKEGAFLAMLLPNPKSYAQSFAQKRLTNYADKTINNILHKMKVAKFLTSEEKQQEIDRKFIWEKQVNTF